MDNPQISQVEFLSLVEENEKLHIEIEKYQTAAVEGTINIQTGVLIDFLKRLTKQLRIENEELRRFKPKEIDLKNDNGWKRFFKILDTHGGNLFLITPGEWEFISKGA